MRSHKSLLAWQVSHSVVHQVLDFCDEHWKPSAAAAFGQLQRSALSVQLNIAEGYALRSPRRFQNHLIIAYGSAVETSDLIELLIERAIVPEPKGKAAIALSKRSQALVMGLLKKLRSQ